MLTVNNPTFGSDFEMFLRDKKGNYFSAVGRIGGTKERPLSIGEGCFRQEDGVLAEFNIPPVDNKKEWLYYIQYCQDKVELEILEQQGLQLEAISAVHMPKSELQSKQACTFGCSPSYNAWSGQMVKKEPPETLRTSGFHVHVGFKYPNDISLEDLQRLIRYFDLYLGVPSILIDPDTLRRELYGEAGDYRYKDLFEQGIIVLEYRSLGGYMINHADWVYNQIIKAIEAFNVNEDYPGAIVRDIIDDNDKSGAAELIQQYHIELPQNIKIYA